jgi:hypothetical protein
MYRDYFTTSDCPQRLAAGASCTFSITFKPTATGDRNDCFLDIENDDTGGDDIGVGLKGIRYSRGLEPRRFGYSRLWC